MRCLLHQSRCVTTKKFLGGHYGFQILFPVGANNRIQGTEIDANPGAGLTDSVFVPMSLGWHFKRADAVANYVLYVPTGRYTDGASDNTGFGMWGNEIAFGTTAYLTGNRQYHAAPSRASSFRRRRKTATRSLEPRCNWKAGSAVIS